MYVYVCVYVRVCVCVCVCVYVLRMNKKWGMKVLILWSKKQENYPSDYTVLAWLTQPTYNKMILW